ncbi:MAG: hypothetical protein ACOVKC_08805 [Brevundimonas sp.]
MAINAGTKAVTGLNSPSNATFANLDQVTLIDAANPDNRMWGAVSAANMGAGTMTVTVAAGAFIGSGTIANWIVIHSALAPGATYNEFWSSKNFALNAAAIL